MTTEYTPSPSSQEYGTFYTAYFSKESRDANLSLSACLVGGNTVDMLIHNTENLLAILYGLRTEGYEMTAQGISGDGTGSFTLVRPSTSEEGLSES